LNKDLRTRWHLDIGRRRLHGFTIVEIMIVMAIMLVLTGLSVPLVKKGLAHYRFSIAVDEFVNQVIFSRVQASSRNRAYRLMVEPGGGSERGTITLTEGAGSRCSNDNFNSAITPGVFDDIRIVDFSDKHPEAMIKNTDQAGVITHGLCFKPDGRVLQVSAAGASSASGVEIAASSGYGDGEAVFYLEKYTSQGEATGIQKVVIVPYNGIPRVELP
jgi:prepilin-type N-terminal cleavage/methylation domain-containing protein